MQRKQEVVHDRNSGNNLVVLEIGYLGLSDDSHISPVGPVYTAIIVGHFHRRNGWVILVERVLVFIHLSLS